jgi:hypothetical protein
MGSSTLVHEMPSVVVDIPEELDLELRAAGLDPAQIVRDSARRGIVEALEAVGTGRTTVGQGDTLPVVLSKPQARSRPVTPALDAVGVLATDTTGKIGVPVVRAADLDDPLVQ